MDFRHIGLPERRCFVSAGGTFFELIDRVIMPDPKRRDIVRRNTREINAGIVRVGAGFAGDGHVVNFRLGAGSGFYRVGHHVHQKPCCALLEYAMRITNLVRVQNHVAFRVEYLSKRQRFLIDTFVCDGCVSRRHLNRR